MSACSRSRALGVVAYNDVKRGLGAQRTSSALVGVDYPQIAIARPHAVNCDHNVATVHREKDALDGSIRILSVTGFDVFAQNPLDLFNDIGEQLNVAHHRSSRIPLKNGRRSLPSADL